MPALGQAIDALVAKQTAFTDAINADLYKRYFGSAEDHVDVLETGGRLQAVIDQVSRYLDDHTGEIDNFGHTLDNISTAIGRSQPQEKVRALVADLVKETQSMAKRNHKLESRLGRIASEVTELRENLEVVQREALTDALTGIPNRKFFDARLREAAREAMRSGRAAEPAASRHRSFQALQRHLRPPDRRPGAAPRRAHACRDSVKGRDTPARFGGEEFAIILPRTNLQQAAIVCRSDPQRRDAPPLRRQGYARGLRRRHAVVRRRAYRASEDLAELVRRADAALYHAKRDGRNRVSTEPNVGDLARAS